MLPEQDWRNAVADAIDDNPLPCETFLHVAAAFGVPEWFDVVDDDIGLAPALAEEFDLSVRCTKTIVYKGQVQIFKHIPG